MRCVTLTINMTVLESSSSGTLKIKDCKAN